MDKRIKKLANNLVNYSTKIQKGENVLIRVGGLSGKPLALQLIKEVYAAGGYPFVEIKDQSITREIALQCSKDKQDVQSKADLQLMKEMDAYISVTATDNFSEMSDIPVKKITELMDSDKPVLDERVNNTKWVVLRYPTNAMAQKSDMSLEKFEDFFYDVCNLDYSKMAEEMESLVSLMEKTDKVHIKGPGTDLKFSIKDINVIPCAGEANIPDGEVYTAPVKDSVNGYITYNTPSNYQGFTYKDIRLEFENGKIVKAEANDTEKINELLDTDEGARYMGEFAIGVNPYITKPMENILFDEKIMGSIHFTPGKSYDDASNGNDSKVHWDIVLIQTPEFGGGEIWFDDVLIRKDGKFVIDELKGLNPENLK
jgi:aminopeptidase